MRRQLLWITLAITIIHSDFAGAQSLPSTSTSKSSHIDLKGLVKRANEGNPVAQSQLGLAYQLGQGVDKDPYEAIRWYRMAANSGDPWRRITSDISTRQALRESRISWKRPNGTRAPPYPGTPRLNTISGFVISVAGA